MEDRELLVGTRKAGTGTCRAGKMLAVGAAGFPHVIEPRGCIAAVAHTPGTAFITDNDRNGIAQHARSQHVHLRLPTLVEAIIIFLGFVISS